MSPSDTVTSATESVGSVGGVVSLPAMLTVALLGDASAAPPAGLLRMTLKCSVDSARALSEIETAKLLEVSPGPKVSVLEVVV